MQPAPRSWHLDRLPIPPVTDHLECEATGEHFSGWLKGPRLLSGETLHHFNAGYVRDIAGNKGRLPPKVIAAASWHLRYFMAAADIRATMCAHTDPTGLVDNSEWWAGRLNASALCHHPTMIHRAISGCTDLWGRPTSNMMMAPREGRKVPVLEELPKLAAERREHYLFERLNRIDEMELTRRRRRLATPSGVEK